MLILQSGLLYAIHRPYGNIGKYKKIKCLLYTFKKRLILHEIFILRGNDKKIDYFWLPFIKRGSDKDYIITIKHSLLSFV